MIALSNHAAPPVLYVVSGAGLSAESGLATFRSAGGIWDRHNLQRVCNFLTWRDHRDEVFEFYHQRRQEVDAAHPCEAHRRLAAWQARWGTNRVRLLTQNVDDLLERGGAQEVIHLHGTLRQLQCLACGHYWDVPLSDYTATTRCPDCNSLKGVKPAVVFFNERAGNYAHVQKMRKHIRDLDVLLVVGTALEVISAEQLIPHKRFGHPRNAQINPNLADIEFFGKHLAQGAGAGLARLEPTLEDWLG